MLLGKRTQGQTAGTVALDPTRNFLGRVGSVSDSIVLHCRILPEPQPVCIEGSPHTAYLLCLAPPYGLRSCELVYLPAKLICKETGRPKYAHDCSYGTKSITIAALPPRLVPQSKLGLGLAVYILLSRFDYHIAYTRWNGFFASGTGPSFPASR